MGAREGGRPTLSDVARRSGVSKTAVSFVLNDRPETSIAAATRARVLQAAADLGYVPNAVAAALSRGHTNVTLVVIDPTYVGEVSSRIVQNITAGIRGLGYTVLVHTKVSDDELVDVVGAVQPFALLLLTSVPPDVRARLKLLGARHVLGADDRSGTDGEVDRFWERAIGAGQARHLAERGHRRIGYALPDADSARLPVACSRLAGAAEECAARGLPAPAAITLPLDRDIIGRDLPALRDQGVTAVCAHDDRLGLGVLAAMADLGWSAPSDLAVVGANNDPESAFAVPRLSTVQIPDIDFGAKLASLLRAAVAGRHVSTKVMREAFPQVEIIRRESS